MAAIFRHKRPAPGGTIILDIDPAVTSFWTMQDPPGATIICVDAPAWLAAQTFSADTLIYCDPPYLHETRTNKNQYLFEMTDDHHSRLLDILLKLPCMVMLSGYKSDLYTQALPWRVVTFQAMTRSGKQHTEYLWCNFPEPTKLHDYRYIGSNYRERERIKRKITRWKNRLASMPAQERACLMAAIVETQDFASLQNLASPPGQPQPEMTMPSKTPPPPAMMATTTQNNDAHRQTSLFPMILDLTPK